MRAQRSEAIRKQDLLKILTGEGTKPILEINLRETKEYKHELEDRHNVQDYLAWGVKFQGM